ncbi:hypothetical protein I4U23_029914 [Adineta vaga]|nr:hypothetical protein I4U23_029914 [Adineta vaga]
MDSDSGLLLLANLSQKITFYCPIVIIIIGNIGCLFNFITFTSRKLIHTSCSLYFLIASIFDLLTLDFGTLTRFLSDHYRYDLYNYSQSFCKIRQYLINTFPSIATCFIVLAAMDRYLCTSSRLKYRSFATIKYAKYFLTFSIIICMLLNIHMLIFADLRPTCSFLSGNYNFFIVIYSLVVTSFMPHFLMLYFGFGTRWHIHLVHHRVIPLNIQQRRRQRTEIQLVTKAMDSFFSQLTTQLFYLNYAKSFYVYTLAKDWIQILPVFIIIYILVWRHAHRSTQTVVSRPTRDMAIMRHILTLVIIDIVCGHPYMTLILLDHLGTATKEWYLSVTVFITMSVTANMCAIFIFNRKLRKFLCSKWSTAQSIVTTTSSGFKPMRTAAYYCYEW